MTTKITATCVLKDAQWTAITFALERRDPRSTAPPPPCRARDRSAAIADPADGTGCG